MGSAPTHVASRLFDLALCCWGGKFIMLRFLTNQSLPPLEKLKNLAASVQFSGVGGSAGGKKWLFSPPAAQGRSQLSPSLSPVWSMSCLLLTGFALLIYIACWLPLWHSGVHDHNRLPQSPFPHTELCEHERNSIISGGTELRGSQNKLLEPQLPTFQPWLWCPLAGRLFNFPDPQFPCTSLASSIVVWAVNITPDSLNSLVINNQTFRLLAVNQAGEGASEPREDSVLADTGFHGFRARNRNCGFTETGYWAYL